MRFKHAIFDCDGVLIDSEAISMGIDTALLRESGVDIPLDEAHRRFVGLTFEAMIEAVEAQFRVKLPPDLGGRKDRRMIEAYRRDLQPVAGVRGALERIGLGKSVGTNGPRGRAVEALKITGLWDYFEGMTTFEDVKDGKPAPDIYIAAAAKAGRDPRDCVVIEDSAAGVTAGVTAGCTVFGFVGTAHEPDAHARLLRGLGAERIIVHMDALPDALS